MNEYKIINYIDLKIEDEMDNKSPTTYPVRNYFDFSNHSAFNRYLAFEGQNIISNGAKNQSALGGIKPKNQQLTTVRIRGQRR